jgi:alcohol dehydrogenase class IV
MRFEFATATRIVFGPGTFGDVGALASGLLGRRPQPGASSGATAGSGAPPPEPRARAVLVVTGRSAERARPLHQALSAAGLVPAALSVPGEPTLDLVRDATRLARDAGAGLVVGIGGGSAIDTAKAVAVLATNPGDPLDYVEVIGAGRALTAPGLPWIAVPTTAGTGAEVTRNAVIASPERRVKVSLRSPLMLARVAVVDPELTHGLPPGVTASSGLDALTQLIEPFVSSRANPVADALCREGMARASACLRRAFERDEPEAREGMSLASLLGGMALANAGLGAVHGFAAPIGGDFEAPHGAVCGRLLPAVMDVNLRAIRDREPRSPALARYEEVANILTGSDTATAEDGVRWAEELVGALGIPGLAAYGVTAADLPGLVERGAAASSMQANPVRLTPSELTGILERSL